MASRSALPCAAIVSLFLCPAILRADKIQITSAPPGATVEVDGKTDITPCEMEFPGSYFHDPHTLLSKRLNHPIVARFSLDGYLPKELPLTEGPLEWVSASGHKRYQYWLLRATHFHVDLDSTGKIPRKPSTDNVKSTRQALLRQKSPVTKLPLEPEPFGQFKIPPTRWSRGRIRWNSLVTMNWANRCERRYPDRRAKAV